ncbi:MAG: hypothetical protein V8Q41_10720 [Anaerostipes hadrus]
MSEKKVYKRVRRGRKEDYRVCDFNVVWEGVQGLDTKGTKKIRDGMKREILEEWNNKKGFKVLWNENRNKDKKMPYV